MIILFVIASREWMFYQFNPHINVTENASLFAINDFWNIHYFTISWYRCDIFMFDTEKCISSLCCCHRCDCYFSYLFIFITHRNFILRIVKCCSFSLFCLIAVLINSQLEFQFSNQGISLELNLTGIVVQTRVGFNVVSASLSK